MRRVVTDIKIATNTQLPLTQAWSCSFGDERWSTLMLVGGLCSWQRQSKITGEWMSVRESNVPDEVLAVWALTR